ncbi:MAG TPA: DsbE family thiol:disulfide interchange protein [Candidatus Limnocylindria bacterium]|jgi:cytochrome c biogenesis protein CcmG/thiol:disulfide interchange protein DsbE|nr:DsbE family thiol:disulfide interchange protein [Candidatus Limnocylindria bacterium]
MGGLGRLRWLVIPLLVVPIGWLLFTGLGRDPRIIPSPLVGKPLPALSGETLDGAAWSSATLAGKPALVNVWASWCSPCVSEHPLLLDVARQHRDDLQMVGVLYQDTADGAAAFLAHYGDGGWPDVDDASGRIAVSLGVTGPPETFFVDADGIVRYHHVGPLTEQVLSEQLAALGLQP